MTVSIICQETAIVDGKENQQIIQYWILYQGAVKNNMAKDKMIV